MNIVVLFLYFNGNHKPQKHQKITVTEIVHNQSEICTASNFCLSLKQTYTDRFKGHSYEVWYKYVHRIFNNHNFVFTLSTYTKDIMQFCWRVKQTEYIQYKYNNVNEKYIYSVSIWCTTGQKYEIPKNVYECEVKIKYLCNIKQLYKI